MRKIKNTYITFHSLDVEEYRNNVEFGELVILGENVWIGGNCSILPGRTIRNSTVIEDGSVVTKDLPVNVVVVGKLCKIIRKNI